MKLSTSCGFAFSLVALLLSGSALPDALTAVQTESAPETDVIVIMRDQLPNLPSMRGARQARSSALASAQTPILAELRRAGARKTHSFALINAIAATVSKDELATLAAHPLVQAVVPDRVIRAPKRSEKSSVGRTPSATSTATATSALCNTLEPEALQLTNTAFADPTIPQAQQVIDGNGKRVTGQGVTVAWLADGLDPNIPGFIRPDGSHVFIDYQDFSGDPAGTPTPGAEAFGDASSIAAQDVSNHKILTYDISKFVNPAHPLPSPCNIRIRGMAPGASLVGLKVFGELGFTTTSSFVQAIEYAVNHDDVDVINESFGGAPFPDNDNDPISLANAAAVKAGVTVTVSTGDAGTAGTLGSPSTDPYVIAAAATTSFRLYAQTGFGAVALAKNGGVVSNNISSFSSGGFAETAALTPSIVAPGDLGWALCSTNTNLFSDCFNFAGAPSPIQDFGGTSESSPLTAGEAALVIQAYRSTHRGADPTPALVKEIIMSTAADLGAPAFEQGAGLINSLAAVNAALSVQDANGGPRRAVGDSLLNNPSLASVTDLPRTPETRTFTITNTGSTTQTLSPALQTLGAPFAGATMDVKLHPKTDPTFLNPTGAPRSYVSRTFTVPAGTQHLDAAIAFKTSPPSQASPFVYFGLFDPSGREVTYSEPQGADSGYGHTDVVAPAAGVWTAYIWTRPAGVTGSYTGTDVQFTWAAERYVTLGSLSPSTLTLAPGASAMLTAQFTMPAQAGDLAAAIRFGQSASLAGTSQAEIPISLRTLVQTSATGGTFTGTLTGGNGRGGTGPTQTYAFDVPNGVKNMSLVLPVADKGYVLEGLLVDPQGMELSVQSNVDPGGTVSQFALQLDRFNPQPGRWRFILLQNYFASGNQTSLPFSARIGFNTAQVTASGLPNSTSLKLHAGKALTIPVTVTNNGAVGEWYFADARLAAVSPMKLQNGDPTACSAPGGPITIPGSCTLFILPTEVSSVQFTAQSSVPITMDAFNSQGAGANGLVGATGSPDLYAQPVSGSNANAVVASLTVPEVPYGIWIVSPSEMGPYGSAGAQPASYTANAFVLTQPFDAAVAADSGDFWADLTLGTATFNPLMLAPGQSGTINVTITPANKVGSTVSGFLYVDTFNFDVSTGDEVVRIPYSYTIEK
jgi:Subtilase family/Peptidase inhibitor I9